MRIAVLILGLLLGVVMVLQSTLVTGLSGVAGDTSTNTAGLGGIIMAILWLVACALVIAVPLLSTVIFAIAAYVGFTFAADFPDLGIWAAASIVLAVLSFFGWLGKRRGERREAARHQELLAAVRANHPGP
jgi:hypothetical protein